MQRSMLSGFERSGSDIGRDRQLPRPRGRRYNQAMCGRYRLSRTKKVVEEHFDAATDDEWMPRYNVAPTQPVPVIRQNPNVPRREMSLMR